MKLKYMKKNLWVIIALLAFLAAAIFFSQDNEHELQEFHGTFIFDAVNTNTGDLIGYICEAKKEGEYNRHL